MEPNPYDSQTIHEPLHRPPPAASQAAPSAWSNLAEIVITWVSFGPIFLVLLPSLYELPRAGLGLLIFELSAIIIMMGIGVFVTVTRLVMLVKKLVSWTRRSENTTDN